MNKFSTISLCCQLRLGDDEMCDGRPRLRREVFFLHLLLVEFFLSLIFSHKTHKEDFTPLSSVGFATHFPPPSILTLLSNMVKLKLEKCLQKFSFLRFSFQHARERERRWKKFSRSRWLRESWIAFEDSIVVQVERAAAAAAWNKMNKCTHTEKSMQDIDEEHRKVGRASSSSSREPLNVMCAQMGKKK